MTRWYVRTLSAGLQTSCHKNQRAPSGFNMQSYKIVLVQDVDVRMKLSAAMLAGNRARVEQAPLTALFLADLGMLKLTL